MEPPVNVMRDSSCLLRREETELAERAKPKQSEEAGYRRTFDSLWHGIGAEAVDRESERLTGVVDWRSIENADYAVGMKSLLFSLMSRSRCTEGHRQQEQFRNHLVAAWTTMKAQCVVKRAKNQPFTSHQSSKSGDPVLPAVSCRTVGWSGANGCLALDSGA